MSPNYSSPGVYIEEISKLAASIQNVPTAIPAFIGHTEFAKNRDGDGLVNVPFIINSIREYEVNFGGPLPETDVEIFIEEFEDGSHPQIIIRSGSESLGSRFNMYYALQHFFENGGDTCYIVSVGDYHSDLKMAKDSLLNGLQSIEAIDEITLILFSEAQGIGDHDSSDYYEIAQQALEQCERLKDRFAIIEVHKTAFDNDLTAISDPINNDGIRDKLNYHLKWGAAYYPNLETTLKQIFDRSKILVTDHILIKESGSKVSHPVSLVGKKLLDPETKDDLANLRKGIYKTIEAQLNNIQIILPPGPAIAGIYSRVDSARGVWKAPANIAIDATIKPTVTIDNQLNERLNIDPSEGKSINAIRKFSGKGTVVWGARTLAGNDNEWRYISVRRFFNMVEESVKKATGAFVFEPNDANTWVRVRSMIENFITIQWRNGALAGAKPDHAFYVRVGIGETMTAQDILEGRMIIEIGMAVVRPAEFIILRITHKMLES
ncbi:MAG: phage tail sheath family protein [Saprospiraceae bacterium]|nr:phage tail sheath family protein [Saprospiraceae bacterium]